MAYDKTKAVFVLDDEELDGSDWANPAFWRGNDQATEIITSIVDSWLEDEKGIYTRGGSYGYRPLTKVRDKVRNLMDSNAALRDRLFEADIEHSNTVMDISCQLSNLHVELQNRKKIFKGLVKTHEKQRIEIRELRDLLEKYVAFALAAIGDAELVDQDGDPILGMLDKFSFSDLDIARRDDDQNQSSK